MTAPRTRLERTRIPIFLAGRARKQYEPFAVVRAASRTVEHFRRGTTQIDAVKMIPLVTLVARDHGPVIIRLAANAVKDATISE